jgi:stage IV sporulation protein B
VRLKKKIFFIVLFIIIALLFVGSRIFINNSIPNKLKMIVNEETDYRYNIPLEARLTGDVKGVLEINNEPVPSDSIVIDLNEPFSITANQTGKIDVDLVFLGIFNIENVELDIIETSQYIPLGNTMGVTVNTDGILVLGIGTLIGEDGKKSMPSSGRLYSGDYIKKINGKEVSKKEDLIEVINASNGEPVICEVDRNNQIVLVEILPVKTSDENEYKIGIWVRDDTQGIGTITYINLNDGTFAALGHGITDIDTKTLIKISKGTLSDVIITGVSKGDNGIPGEISGLIVNNDDEIIGNIEDNTCNGIYGTLTDFGISRYCSQDALPIGLKNEVELGEATIKSDVSGTMEEYDIEIEKIFLNDESNKGMIIKVVDEDLINETNGIVQGMSGSPIIQNGKLIGAVTHVFVQDSTKGYGVFIENMLIDEDQ